MALVLGTNCGFVTVAPVADPAGTNGTCEGESNAIKHTSPATAVKVTEIGWWCDNATEEANYEVTIYTHDAGNDEPQAIITAYRTNAKGTGSGWIKVTGLNITISPSTIYWIAWQLDNTATPSLYNWGAGTARTGALAGATLPDPWSGGTLYDNDLAGVYAVWEAAAPGGAAGIMTPNTGFWGPTF